jgi:dsDNA-specific endonuclease/ATPase MutS2
MNTFIKIFVPVGLVIVLAWFAWWAAVEKMTPQKAEQGQIGDLFGGINALFSGLALAGVVTAVVLQSRELQLQREAMNKQNEELELTRNEIKLQREQLELQREELRLSREEFERMASANEEAAKALSKQIKMQVLASRINGLSSQLDSANSRNLARATVRNYIAQDDVNLITSREEELSTAMRELDEQIGI